MEGTSRGGGVPEAYAGAEDPAGGGVGVVGDQRGAGVAGAGIGVRCGTGAGEGVSGGAGVRGAVPISISRWTYRSSL